MEADTAMHPDFVPGKPGLQIIPAGIKGRFFVVDGDGAKTEAKRYTRAQAEAIIAKDDAERAPAASGFGKKARGLEVMREAGFLTAAESRTIEDLPAVNTPLLSICIPTRNRPGMLRTCLAELAPVLRMLPFPVEVVISDNCSDEPVPEITECGGAPVRIIRQPKALDVVESYLAAMRHAHGKYANYLADDDALEPEGLIAAVEWMERTPSMVGCFNPQKNVAQGTDALLGMENDLLDKPAILTRQDYVGLTDIISRKQFHPEVPLARSEVWRRHITTPRKVFFGFWLIGCLLEAGDVGIGTHPFYLHRQRAATDRHPQIQYEFAVDRMDQHRLGLEMIYLRAARQAGGLGKRAALADWFAGHMAIYAEIAARVSFSTGDEQAGAEFLARAALWRGTDIEECEAETLDSRIATEIAKRAGSTDGHIQVVETASARQAIIDAGAAPETVVAREDLAAALMVLPPQERKAAAA
jgi:glycosyltransferase involved in cell wall biosynthesis